MGHTKRGLLDVFVRAAQPDTAQAWESDTEFDWHFNLSVAGVEYSYVVSTWSEADERLARLCSRLGLLKNISDMVYSSWLSEHWGL